MSLLYIGRITKLEIGTTVLVNEDIDNVILMNWERNHDVRPRLYANLKYPTSYQQPHSWIVGSFSCLSDNHTAIYETDVIAATAGDQYALVEDGDSNVIDFFQVTYQDEDGNQRVTRFFYPIIYRYNKELLNYDDSVWIYHFLAGYAVDSEESPIAYDLIECDANSQSVYLHNGITSSISTSFSSPAAAPEGVTIDCDGNLISSDNTNQSIYIHVGITSTISTSFSTPSTDPSGITMDATTTNLISCDRSGENSVYIHVGITSTISTSFSLPGAYPRNYVCDLGIDDNGNLLHVDLIKRSIYLHVGVTATISTSFSTTAPSPLGVVYNDALGDLLSSSLDNDSVYIHSGITSTVSTSFSTPDTSPHSLTLTA